MYVYTNAQRMNKFSISQKSPCAHGNPFLLFLSRIDRKVAALTIKLARIYWFKGQLVTGADSWHKVSLVQRKIREICNGRQKQ